MKFAVMSLGCRLNMAEIQSVSSKLQEAGHELTDREKAEIYIINSCTVTLASDRKTRQMLYQSQRAAEGKRDPRIIVAGCAAGTERREGNVYYISNDHKYLIPRLVEDWSLFDRIMEQKPSRFDFSPALKSSRTRINIKIQDGCDNFCSYCIIPFVRGLPCSRPLQEVLREFRLLTEAGYREFLLTGICIGDYLHEGTALEGLLRELLNVPGEFRIHLSSISPLSVTPALADILRHEKLVKHLSLSLQSGSNSVLERMNRHYTREQYIAVVDSVRKNIPLFNFTTDVIVGFPGESDDDFNDTLDLVREAGFSHIHTFRYSPRPGTAAASMTDTVPEPVKSERSSRIMELSGEQKRKYYSAFENGVSLFLSERSRNGTSSGFNEYYVPVSIPERFPRNTFIEVRTALSEDGNFLTGTPLHNAKGK